MVNKKISGFTDIPVQYLNQIKISKLVNAKKCIKVDHLNIILCHNRIWIEYDDYLMFIRIILLYKKREKSTIKII